MVSQTKKRQEGLKVAAVITVNCDPKLKDLAGKKADAAGISLSEWCAQAIANDLKLPELGKVPRKQMGRPRKEIIFNGK